jgi:hypothetical protein
MGAALDEVVATVDGQVLGVSEIDECYEGQRNWKVDTGYDYRCSLLIGVLIGIDGDFRAQMLDADVALSELGWQSGDGEWPGQLVDGYWDLRAGESPDGHVRLDRLPGPLTVTRGDLRLLFDYGSVIDDRGLDRIDRSQQSTPWCCGLPFFDKREPMDVDQATGAQRHEHLILITVEGHYFQK